MDLVNPVFEDEGISGTINVLLNDGQGGLGPYRRYSTSDQDIRPEPKHVRLFDVDADGDARLDLTDAVSILDALFRGRMDPSLAACLDRGDADDSGTVGITDAIRLLLFLFQGGPPPPPPFPEQGTDATVDDGFCWTPQ